MGPRSGLDGRKISSPQGFNPAQTSSTPSLSTGQFVFMLYEFRCCTVKICHFPAVETGLLFNFLFQSIFLSQGCKNPGR